jgi:DNA polymerase II
MTSHKGFIVYPSYETRDDRTIIQLFGKLESGNSFLVVSEFKPYFYIKTQDVKKVKKHIKPYDVKEIELTNFQGEKVSKISFDTQPDLNKIHDAIKKEITTYEADIRPHYRFLMDNNILGNIEIHGDSFEEPESKVDKVFFNPDLEPLKEFNGNLKLASIDIESGDGLYCIGISTDKEKKNFLVNPTKKNLKLKNTILCRDEKECLEKFKQELIDLDPDIITGWNVIDFDLVYLKALFTKHKIPFNLGRNESNTSIKVQNNFFRSSTVNITGRQVLDGLNFVRDPFIQEAPSIKNAKFESYTLENVAQSLLGKGKLMKGSGRHDEITELYESNSEKQLQKLVDYNLLDCELAYKILEKTKALELSIERSQLTGMPLDRIGGSIANFDSLYIRTANAKGLVSPTMVFTKKEERITGGYVHSTTPGIYENVLILDFKSLYPSIIKTFNIDPASLLEKKEPKAIESPNKAYFKNSQGILPEIITNLHKAREKAKSEKRELSSYAIKIIMNSFFGVLASPNCRYFSMDMANAITHFGQFIIKLTASEIEKLGHKVIYMDTDSVFVVANKKDKDFEELGKKLESHINEFYKKYTKKKYNRESFLELEYEKLYLSLMIPQVRGDSKAAAKKRYAGLVKKPHGEIVEITGLEAIRGDWTEAAQDFQKELLMKVFHKEEISKFIISYIKKIEEGKLDEKLIYRKSIRKNLEEYTKTTPPHVKAARKLPKLDSNLIEYYITTDGPEPIQLLKHKLDYKHYIDKQIKPIANQVLTLFNKEFDDIIQGSKQAKLF